MKDINIESDPCYKNMAIDSPGCITGKSDHYKYLNYNPCGIVIYEDELFQILSYTLPEKTKEEISDIILNEMLSVGETIYRKDLIDKALKKYLYMTKVELPKGYKVSDLIDNWELFIPRGRAVLVRLYGRYEIFLNGVFYSRDVINEREYVYSTYLYERIVDDGEKYV